MGYKKTGYMKEDQEKIRVRKSAAKRLSSTSVCTGALINRRAL